MILIKPSLMIFSRNCYESLKQFGNDFNDDEWRDLEFQAGRHIPIFSLQKDTSFMFTELVMNPNDADPALYTRIACESRRISGRR